MGATLMQANGGGNTGGGTLPVSFDNPTAPGGFVVVMLADAGVSGPYVISDDKGNVYSQAIDDNNSTSFEVAIWYLLSSTGGINTITLDSQAAPGTLGLSQAIIAEFTGVYNGALEQIALPTSTGGSTFVSNPITTTNTDLLIGMMTIFGTTSVPTSDSPWVDIFLVTGAFGLFHTLASLQADTSSGTYSYSGTKISGLYNSIIIMSFIEGSPFTLGYQVTVSN